MQTKAKRWLAISFAVILVLLFVTVYSQRETPSETVHIGFAGPSLVETNAVLFTITNQNEFPVRYQLSVQNSSGISIRSYATKRGDVFPSNTFTFFVPVPSLNQWRVGGDYWNASPPKLSPARTMIVGLLLTIKLQRLSEWLARPQVGGTVVGPRMELNHPI